MVPEGEEGDPGGGGEAAVAEPVAAKKEVGKEDLGARQLAAMAAAEKSTSAKTKVEPSPFAQIDFGVYAKKIVSFLARNFFTMKAIALIIAFIINFMLLFYKVNPILLLLELDLMELISKKFTFSGFCP